jgi:hypothetical protein
VWTTRKYVLEEALAETRLGETTKDFPKVHAVVVEVDKLSTLEERRSCTTTPSELTLETIR